MLSIFETGDENFRLVNQQDENVGWVRGNALGFDGFATESDAMAAALAGSEALKRYVARMVGSTEPTETPTGRLKVVHDGAYEWISRGKEPLARLYRPERDVPRRERSRTYGVEFVLPSYVRPGAVISASQVVHHAITAAPTVYMPAAAATVDGVVAPAAEQGRAAALS